MEDKDQLVEVGCAQFLPRFGEVEANLRKIEEVCLKTSARLIVFPELCTSGYEFISTDEVAELAFCIPESEPAQFLIELAFKTKKFLVVGFPERGDRGCYNSCALFTPEGGYYVYRKVHLFDREKSLFLPGDKEFFVVETDLGRLGMMICFDWAFPEVARVLALKGAQILCHPSNLVLQFCQRAMFARSVENGIFTLTCNRIGTEGRAGRSLTFTGASQILSPRGEVLAQASVDKEEVITATINPSAADHKMLTSTNHLFHDRRPEFYQPLVERV